MGKLVTGQPEPKPRGKRLRSLAFVPTLITLGIVAVGIPVFYMTVGRTQVGSAK